MPFAEFQPSNAGAQINDQILRNADFGASLMERAQRSSVLAQDAEMRKQRFVTEQVLSDQQIQENRLKLSRMEGEQKATAAKNRAAVLESDGHFEHLTASEAMLADAAAEAPSLASKLNAATDPDEIESLTNDFVARYAHLAGDKDYAIRFDRVARPVTSVVSVKTTALRQRYAAAANGLRAQVIPGNSESLAAARQSPFFAAAFRDPQFRKEWEALAKDESERNNKIAEQNNKNEGQIKVDTAKTDGDIRLKQTPAYGDKNSRELSVPGFDGMAPTKEEAVKFRETVATNTGILNDLNQILDLSAKQGATTDLGIRTEIDSIQKTMVGKLRLPLTGPGAFTDDERKFVLGIIGNPAKIFGISSVERKRLQTLSSYVTNDIDRQAATLGLSRSAASSPKSSSTGSTGGDFAAYIAEAKKRGLPVFNSKFSR